MTAAAPAHLPPMLLSLALAVAMASTSACGPDLDEDDSLEPLALTSARYEEFVKNRQDNLLALSEPIADCVQRSDTAQAAFHGCVDWHSAVHATWSLSTLARLTGEPLFQDLVDDTLDELSVSGELAILQTGGPSPGEVPYGYAWFLALARERERSGYDDLVEHAAVVAADLEEHVFDAAGLEPPGGIVSPAYSNLSWAMWNLRAQAVHEGNTDLVADLDAIARDQLAPLAGTCPVESEADRTSDFFPPCLHLARLLERSLSGSERDSWLAEAVPVDLDLEPVTNFPTAHPAGLNFSRAWGLWSLAQATDDPELLDQYVDHVETHIALPEAWAEDYAHSHWVAQFGVYAIALSFGEDP